MENQRPLSDAELTTPPGEGLEENQQFAIRASKSYTDELIISKIDEQNQIELSKRLTNEKNEISYQKIINAEKREFEELLQSAENNLKKMATESEVFKKALTRFRPRGLWIFRIWKPIAFIESRLSNKGFCECLLYLTSYLELRMKVFLTKMTRDIGVVEKNCGHSMATYEVKSLLKKRLRGMLQELSDPKKTIHYFAEQGWLKT